MDADTISDRKKINVIVVLILIAGFIFRLRQYVYNRSLWIDEASLALNVVHRSFWDLVKPLDYSQGAPLGFLFIQKAIISVLGNTDYFLRLFPFAASVISLILVYFVAKSYLKGTGRILFALLFSSTIWLIYYSSECKQYSSDVLVTLLLLFFASKTFRHETTSRNILVLALVGCISLWFSHPALFVMCGVVAGTVFSAFKGDSANRRCLLLLYLAWIISFIILYLVSYGRLAANAGLLEYWKNYFIPMPPWEHLIWFRMMFFRMLIMPAGLSLLLVSALLALTGVLAYVIRMPAVGAMLAAPLLVTLVASGLQKYPFGDRLLLFMLPLLYLFIAAGMEEIHDALEKKSRIVAYGLSAIVVVALIATPAVQVWQNFRTPYNDEDIKTVLKYASQRRQTGDTFYVYYSAIPAFKYYAPMYGLEKITSVEGVASRGDSKVYLADIMRHAGKNRVWFIFTHNYTKDNKNEVKFFLSVLDKLGSRIDEKRSTDAAAFLYRL